ncbi:MAG: ribosomal protein S18-alanine N-acetyltransferase [Herminiimonas sp.]|nr:ribosomal protein S18-alanine N-acetyltransferase [Herminiimonas sp.]
MSAVQQPGSDAFVSMRFDRMTVDDLHLVQAIEDDVYPFPWTRGNFLDSLYSGYDTWVLRDGANGLAGYFLLMLAVDEAHLLNVSVRRELHGCGVGRLLLDKVVSLSRQLRMMSVLLEVRPSNVRALQIYERYGFQKIGLRKSYYPPAGATREDAIVMRLPL